MPMTRQEVTLTKATLLRELFKKNPRNSAEVAAGLVGCSTSLADKIKAELRHSGEIPDVAPVRDAQSYRPKPPEEFISTKPPEIEKEVQDIIASKTLTLDEQKRMLSGLGKKAVREETRVSALKALASLEQMTGSRAEFGPGKPLTIEDRSERLGLLLKALGESESRGILQSTFKQKGPDESSSQNPPHKTDGDE